MSKSSNMEIDDSLYSRQRYVLGDSAMHKLASSNVLVFGLGGLGLEIAKNLILAGIKSIVIHDTKQVSEKDMSCQFFVKDEDIGLCKTRAHASLQKLAELNNYVHVSASELPIDETCDLDFIANFQCIIMTECSLEFQLRVNKFCRQHQPQIKFIVADVFGLFCWSFCDFGDEFEVADGDGEDPKEVFIGDITKSNPGIVTTADLMRHGFEDGDVVVFSELTSMQVLNGVTCPIKVLSHYTFSIMDTSSEEFSSFTGRGIVKKLKMPSRVQFNSLEDQLMRPSYLTPDLGKMTSPLSIHLGMLTLHKFVSMFKRLPLAWNVEDFSLFLALAEPLCNESTFLDWNDVNRDLLECLSYTSQGCFTPLCAFLGGVVAQEALKALSGKFTPIQQWLHFDVIEILRGANRESCDFQTASDRFGSLRICIGENLCKRLRDLKVFMVGCGAIGCELLKNFALLGIGSDGGQVVITDNDLIEKSNLNRQFLFRPEHIQKPKSVVAASSALQINRNMHILPQQHKVGWETEASIYTDTFYKGIDVVVNALDNVEARRYMDSRCVSNQKPLLESGTMSTKGHVQVIAPFLTESYNSQNDPVDGVDIPYCTLRSFPANIEHCIEWAREEFWSKFIQKTDLYNDFWSKNLPEEVLNGLERGILLDNCNVACKMAANLPLSWKECVTSARMAFEKSFYFKAKELLSKFPLDTKLNDGSLFWQLPKRQPSPVKFDSSNTLHMLFINSCARLLASVCGIEVGTEESVLETLSSVVIPPFVPKNKYIETDETATKPQKMEEIGEQGAMVNINRVKAIIQKFGNSRLPCLRPERFEKDDDSNGHIDYIASASNLRATMYGIAPEDRLKIKRIAGRIVPAIATITAAISALVTIELVKLARQMPLCDYKNSFLNLALPLFVLSEPGAVKKTVMKSGNEFTIWDKWEITGNPNMTLEQFMKAVMLKYKEEPTFVVQGTKLIFSADMFILHKKRLNQKMMSLLKIQKNKPYVDLVVSFRKGVDVDGCTEDESGPEMRYFHGGSVEV